MVLAVSLTNLNLIDAAEVTTGWSFSGITKTALSIASREGTNCIGGQVANASFGYAWHTHGSPVNMTTSGNERVYIWVNSVGPGTYAQEGWGVLIGDGTNRRAYRVGGSDVVPFSVKGWYCLMLDTANLPTTYQQQAGAAEPDLTAITQFGFSIYNTVAPSGNALNVFVDIVRYGSGLVVTSGATDDVTLAQVAADDFSSATGKAYGIIRAMQTGVYGIQGDILWGDTAGSSIDFKETDSVVVFEDRVHGAGSNTKFKFSGQHSGSGTFRMELGVVVGSGDDERGRSGVIFISANAANQPVDFDFSDSDIEDVFIYGCIFTNLRAGIIAFSSDATNGISHHISGTTFSGCSQVDIGVTVVRNCTFAATGDAAAALLWNASINIKNCIFIANTTGAGIEHGTSGEYDYNTLLFDGNTNDINNTSGDTVTINKLLGSDPSSYTGSLVLFVLSVTLLVTVETVGGVAIQDARVAIFRDSDGATLVNELTDASGEATEQYNYGAGPDVPVTVVVRKSSSPGIRYIPYELGTDIEADGLALTVPLVEDGIAL